MSHSQSRVSSVSAPQVASSTPYLVLSTTYEILTFSCLPCIVGNSHLSIVVFHISIYMIVLLIFVWFAYRWTKARDECWTLYTGTDILYRKIMKSLIWLVRWKLRKVGVGFFG